MLTDNSSTEVGEKPMHKNAEIVRRAASLAVSALGDGNAQSSATGECAGSHDHTDWLFLTRAALLNPAGAYSWEWKRDTR